MPKTVLTQGKILIVDDEKANVRFLEIILEEAGFSDIYSTTDSRECLALFRGVRPDIVLLDLAMPHLDGFAVMQQLHHEMTAPLEVPEDSVPVIVLTADSTSATRHRALQEGARDFLTKPLDAVEVLLRINNLLQTRFHSVLLEAKVRERTQDLEKAQLETLQRLAIAAEYRDDDTGLHTKRVGVTAGLIAQALALPESQCHLLRLAARFTMSEKLVSPMQFCSNPEN